MLKFQKLTIMSKHTHRYIARVVVEAATPLFVGSGESSLLKDALVQKDWNGLPMIQGTSLAGVLRHSIEDTLDSTKNHVWKDVFGHQDSKEGLGSRLKISSAYMMINDTEIAETLGQKVDEHIKSKYDNLPSRQHVRITDRGVAAQNGLFDNEVVYKGTRFIFEIELKGTANDASSWESIINKLHEPLFRIGQGSRKGYGDLKVIGIYNNTFDLRKEDQFNSYIGWAPSFNSIKIEEHKQEKLKGNLIEYKLDLTPDDFFIFSEGFGDDDVDNKPLEEEIAIYENSTIKFESQSVLPASSIKGAIAHRTCFHYNKLKKIFSDEIAPNIGMSRLKEMVTGGNNRAVNELFGTEEGFTFKNNDTPAFDRYSDQKESVRGRVIINDIYKSKSEIINNKIFNHVAIDRFTGGGMEGALFSEKVSRLSKDGDSIELIIYLEKEGFSEYVLDAFENTLLDITKGLLPLGGMTTKGNGMFTGTVTKDGDEILKYHTK